MKRMKESELEEELGNSYQIQMPEKIISREIYNRIDGYALEADCYTLQLQQKAEMYRNKIQELEAGE